eukprot:TRINITY_DN552_c0_g4_i1.p1 TRINITY_DN552_c0_g4~~TRINITY_DN552_c0_g4_i1.p1  ORF type:complete len:211 (-),score=58.82 TRINITY_DN552_c0_g4_i1:122-754(-)
MSRAGGEELVEHIYKVIVVGDVGTGKTSIIKRYVHRTFSVNYKATIGVDFALKLINWDAKTVVRLQLWDIAGQERFGNMTRVYYKEAVGAVVVFDVTRVATFDAVSKWKSDIDLKVILPNDNPIPVVLLANKIDMAKDGWHSTSAQMDKYCEENGFIGWFETSAKDNINVEKAMQFLLSKIIENDQDMVPPQPGPNPVEPTPAKQKGGCC